MTLRPIPFDKLYDYHYFNCENQEKLFELSQNMGFDDDDFIQKYMESDFCKRELDQLYSYFQMAEPEDIMDYALKEIKPKRNIRHYNRNAIKWTGYMYRYLHLRLAVNSAVIYRTLPLKDMLVYYVGMHTQSDEYFIDIIKDKF